MLELIMGGLRRGVRFLLQHGPAGVMSILAARAAGAGPDSADRARADEAVEFDRRHGVETTQGRGEWEHLGAVPGSNWIHGMKYEGVDEKEFNQAVGALPLDPKDYAFVDLGSGKGKALLLAAAFGFRKIVGVEYSPALHEAALRNLEAFFKGARPEIEALCLDAAEYALPGGPCLVCLFNPFDGSLLDAVLAKAQVSLEREPRPLFFLYFHAKRADVFSRRGFVERARWSFRDGATILFEAA